MHEMMPKQLSNTSQGKIDELLKELLSFQAEFRENMSKPGLMWYENKNCFVSPA